MKHLLIILVAITIFCSSAYAQSYSNPNAMADDSESQSVSTPGDLDPDASDIAAAQTAPPPVIFDPKTLDVAGVRLGMTPNEAIASLKKFDPKLKIAKQYLNSTFAVADLAVPY